MMPYGQDERVEQERDVEREAPALGREEGRALLDLAGRLLAEIGREITLESHVKTCACRLCALVEEARALLNRLENRLQ